jgi:hypothetical protein
LFVGVMVLYPLIHYVTHTSESLMYQYPMQPEMLALATSALFKRSTNSALEPSTLPG